MDDLNGAPSGDIAGSSPVTQPQYIPGADIDDMNQQPSHANLAFDDRLGVLDYFTRKEIMRMTFDTSTRLFQSVAFPDRKPLPQDKALAYYRQVFEQTLAAACICLSDDVMKAAFSKMTASLGHSEDPWELALLREFNRVMQQQAEG
ncbi:MAG: hypothetical protein DI537_05375 [Stutzerimonas stutzeri]|nr:MAG: hypothetical protein DI537_05375 [Stutzerimonas stutzeri]